MQFVIEAMRVGDIPTVSAIERLSFPQPWPQSAYRREILENRMAYYIVARAAAFEPRRPQAARPVAGAEPERDDGSIITKISRLFRPGDQVGTEEGERGIVGYAGLWLMTDEAHVTTIAVHPDFRGKHIGESLLLSLIDRAIAIGARWVTLEVRVTNSVAQNLYRKYTFKEMGVRRRYYSDNNEDALIMWTDALDSERFSETLERNRIDLQQRLETQAEAG